MANKLQVYQVEDTRTGKVYNIEGPQGASDEELFSFLEQDLASGQPATVTPTPNTAPPQAPVEAPAPAGPSGVQPREEAPRQEIQTSVINTTEDFGDPRFLGAGGEQEYTQLASDPNVSWEQVNDFVRQQATAKGLPAPDVMVTPADLDRFRQELSESPDASVGAVTYQDWRSALPQPEATVTAPENDPILRAYQDAIQYGTPGWLARTYHDWMGTGMEQLRKKFPDATPEQLEEIQENVINYVQRGVRSANIEATEDDPMIPWLAGQIIGSAGVEDFVPFLGGAGVAGRVGQAAGINTAADVGYQAADVAAGVQDEFNLEQAALAPVVGAAFHGAIEGAGALARTRGPRTEDSAPAATVPGVSEGIFVPSGRKNSKAYKEGIAQSATQMADHINRITDGWSNAPVMEVHKNFKDMEGIDDDGLGVTTADGKVLLNAENILAEAKTRKVDPEDIVSAVTYHEALGHHGLSQKFEDDLQNILSDFYNNSTTSFRNMVDDWLEKYPEAYQGAQNRHLRAAEEVLAEMSEAGRMPATFVNRLTNLVKDFARRIGLNLKYSKREIETIMGLVHDGVVVGPRNKLSVGGNRYMYTGLYGHQALNERGFYDAPPAYDEAVYRAETGEDAGPGSVVHQETGWFLGPDRRWRMEIDDSQAKIDLRPELFEARAGLTSLETVLDHPALFDLYPELRHVNVTRNAPLFDVFGSLQGSFNPETNTINITPSAKDPEGTLLHEIQHWVQEKEGFSSGGSSASALKAIPDKKLVEVSKKVADYYNKEANRLKAQQQFYEAAVTDPTITAYTEAYHAWRQTQKLPYDHPDAKSSYKTMTEAEDAVVRKLGDGKRWISEVPEPDRSVIKELLFHARPKENGESGLKAVIRELNRDVRKNMRLVVGIHGTKNNPAELRKVLQKEQYLPFQAYQHLFGEVEARDTTKRRFMNDTQRRNLTPYTSEDFIEPNDYIFDRGMVEAQNMSAIPNQELVQRLMRTEGMSEMQAVNRARAEIFKNSSRSGIGRRDTTELDKYIEQRVAQRRQDREGGRRDEDQRLSAAEETALLEYAQAHSIRPSELLAELDAGTNPEARATIDARVRQLAPIERYMKRRTKEEISDEESVANAHEILSQVLDNYEPTHRSWAEAKSAARAKGLTAKQVRKAKGIQDLDKRLFQYDTVADATDQTLTRLHEKMNNGTFTMKDKARYLETIYSYVELLGRIFDDQAQIGRALNAMKALSFTKRKISDLNEILKDYQGNNISAFADEETFNKFAKQIQLLIDSDNKAGLHNALVQVVKPYWWQFGLSFRHAMMLSGLGTHAKNAADNAMMIARELEEQIIALPGGVARKGLRAAGADVQEGVSPQEVGARVYGLLRALFDGSTYKETLKAFREGHGTTPYSSKIEMQDARIPIVSKVQDTLHASDTFFRAFHMNANLYTLGVRKARQEGFTGLAAFEEGTNLAANPTYSMIQEAKNLTDTALLVDTPSTPSARLEALKAIKPGMKAGEQATSFFANLLFPFFRVTDRLIFQKLRRSPLAFVDHITRQDLAAGGARMDIAIARMVYGSALIYYYWQQAGEGEIEGRAPGDYEKRQALEAGGYKPNSVRRDGKYIDASALNLSPLPWQTQNSVATNIASIREAYETNKADSDSTAQALGYATLSLLKELASTSFANNLTPYTEALAAEEYEEDAAIANVAGGLASQFVPAAVRQYNQMYADPIRRDTTGDKSIPDRIYGRVASAIPGLSDDLPARYDVYGDMMEQGRTALSIGNYQEIKDDEVSVELQRLERTTEEPVVRGAPSSFEDIRARTTDNPKGTVKLTAAGRQEWQRVQGYYLRLGMSQTIPTDEWKSASDEEKIQIVKEVRTEAYELTKEYMLPLLGVTSQEEEE